MNNDVISRQAAINYLMSNMTWYSEEGYEVDEAEKLSAITDLINGVPSAESKMYDELLTRLREHYEWAKANEWEAPITLSDDLKEAADAIDALSRQLTEYHKYDSFLAVHGCFAEPPKEANNGL